MKIRSMSSVLLCLLVAATAYGGDGDVVCIWKASGRIQLDTACQSVRQSGSIEFFDPGMDPFADKPFQYFPREGETEFVRMTVDPCRE